MKNDKIKQLYRINDHIRAKEVRLVSDNNNAEPVV
ncbi:MAG: translation initiation factor IF-3, partial [Bacteroidaceae bacterium]